MKIIYVTHWYSEGMGYLENCLPAEMVKLGHEVHLISSTAQVYYNQAYWREAYGAYLGEPIVEEQAYEKNGVKIHRLPFKTYGNRIRIVGLTNLIREIKPDVVHTFQHSDFDTLRLVFTKWTCPFKLFTANHTSYLALFPTKEAEKAFNWRKRLVYFLAFKLTGIFIAAFIKKCFCVTTDAADVAAQYYGIPRSKLKVTTLGVDTEQFKPDRANRNRVRKKLGISEETILCIYTGKFLKLRRADLLASAILNLRQQGLDIQGLFIGEGEDSSFIKNTEGCFVLPLQPHQELPQYYQAADIAVWPFGESSSQLDAVATGLCLVMGDATVTYALVLDNSEADSGGRNAVPVEAKSAAAYRPKIISRFYKTYDLDSLTEKIAELASPSVRATFAAKGRQEVLDKFSWAAIARQREADYD
jgi:glycosyltransferase involved in cell wall biosynthesis